MATDETTSRAVQASSAPERPATPAQQRATQHQGTTDADVLVSDIEKTRVELASTIDEIVDRVSPKKVVERTKLQAAEAAKQGVHDATVLVKEAAGVVREKAVSAGELLKERTGPATEAVKGAAATVKDRVGGPGDSASGSSALVGAGSVGGGGTPPVTPAGPAETSTAAYESVRSPLPAGTVSIEAGAVPPLEPVDTSGSLADAAEAARPSGESAGADVPAYAPVRTQAGPPSPSPVPVLAGAGVAAVVALLLLLLRRRSR